ncbi:class E sortase [Candidatus Giovannonibacteria bacterium]|nr:class E sortase [Candidatus Giovannonibacteria bacterium]
MYQRGEILEKHGCRADLRAKSEGIFSLGFLGLWLVILLGIFALIFFTPIFGGNLKDGISEVFLNSVAWVFGSFTQGDNEEASPAVSESETVPEDENARISFEGGVQLVIPKAGVQSQIVFPIKNDWDYLTASLLKGPVHYPGSVMPGEVGNMFVFGHSAGVLNPRNKNSIVFNNLKELKYGDAIYMRSNGYEYAYKVLNVQIRRAEDAEIDFHTDGRKILTLSTCKIFGANEERYIVEAEFVKRYPFGATLLSAGASS